MGGQWYTNWDTHWNILGDTHTHWHVCTKNEMVEYSTDFFYQFYYFNLFHQCRSVCLSDFFPLFLFDDRDQVRQCGLRIVKTKTGKRVPHPLLNMSRELPESKYPNDNSHFSLFLPLYWVSSPDLCITFFLSVWLSLSLLFSLTSSLE